jgi:hypothetical protein
MPFVVAGVKFMELNILKTEKKRKNCLEVSL